MGAGIQRRHKSLRWSDSRYTDAHNCIPPPCTTSDLHGITVARTSFTVLHGSTTERVRTARGHGRHQGGCVRATNGIDLGELRPSTRVSVRQAFCCQPCLELSTIII